MVVKVEKLTTALGAAVSTEPSIRRLRRRSSRLGGSIWSWFSGTRRSMIQVCWLSPNLWAISISRRRSTARRRMSRLFRKSPSVSNVVENGEPIGGLAAAVSPGIRI